MSIDPSFAPHSGKDLGRWMKWVEERLRYLGSGRNLIERGSVSGGVVTIQEILTNPTGPVGFENTDRATCPADGADIPIPLSFDPKPGSEQVFYAGLPLERADWTRSSTLLTIPGEPWFVAGQPAWVNYAYDGTVSAIGPLITSPTAGEVITDTTPTITGTGSPGYTITVKIDGASVGTTTVDASGAWSVTSSVLSTGAHTVVATQTGPLEAVASPSVSFTIPSPTYASLVAALSPLVWARMGEATITGSATMVDSSGNGRNGTYVLVTGSTTGIVSSEPTATAAAFPGSPTGTDVAFVPYGVWLNSPTLAWLAWIKPTAIGTIQSIWDRDYLASARDWQFRINAAGKVELLFWDAGGTLHVVTGTTTLVAGTVYMVGAKFDGTVATVYVNGAVDATLPFTGSLHTSTNDLTFGVCHAGSGSNPIQYYAGKAQEAALFTDLSDADFANLYAAGI